MEGGSARMEARAFWPRQVSRLLELIPPEPPSAPVSYSARLVTYVVAVCVAAATLAIVTVRVPSDVSTLVGSRVHENQSTIMEDVANELRNVQRDLRHLIFQLSPHDLHEPGRLRQEIATKQLAPLRERRVDTQLDVPETVPLDKSSLELVHRVCGEALTNVLRHARASHVAVAIAVNDSSVVLTIRDDGRGFSPEDVAHQRAQGHFGMRFLEEKAEVAHGTLEIQSAPGEGSRMCLRLPALVDHEADG